MVWWWAHRLKITTTRTVSSMRSSMGATWSRMTCTGIKTFYFAKVSTIYNINPDRDHVKRIENPQLRESTKKWCIQYTISFD